MCCETSETTRKDSSSGCCTCGCGCDTGSGFKRRFWTKEERKECLEAYKSQLTKELAALDECVREGCC
jgi:hypothetical protein